jgi:hypothetical protein
VYGPSANAGKGSTATHINAASSMVTIHDGQRLSMAIFFTDLNALSPSKFKQRDPYQALRQFRLLRPARSHNRAIR